MDKKKILIGIIILLGAIVVFQFTQRTDITSCSQDSECIVVDSIEGLQYIPSSFDECGCNTAAPINSKYLTLWEQKREEFKGKMNCDVLCKIMPSKEEYIAKCINNKCTLQFK